jgi:hypothetical protein
VRRLVAVVAVAAALAGACGEGGSIAGDDAFDTLHSMVGEIRTAAVANDRAAVLHRIEELRATVETMVDQNLLEPARGLEILDAAERVEQALPAVTTTTVATTAPPPPPAPAPAEPERGRGRDKKDDDD